MNGTAAATPFSSASVTDVRQQCLPVMPGPVTYHVSAANCLHTRESWRLATPSPCIVWVETSMLRVCLLPFPQIDVAFTGAALNRTWPSSCTEGANNVDASGNGVNLYVCIFSNSSARNAVQFAAAGHTQCECFPFARASWGESMASQEGKLLAICRLYNLPLKRHACNPLR